MKVGVPRETWPGEHRVALIPSAAAVLKKSGLDVVVEADAGSAAGFPSSAYEQAGVTVAPRDAVFAADIILQVRSAPPDVSRLRRGQVVIGFADPLGAPDAIRVLAQAGVTAFSMELMPRITRAQSMDALSSMATIAG
jgi:NAD(P) transhydrogenase subunit alpha